MVDKTEVSDNDFEKFMILQETRGIDSLSVKNICLITGLSEEQVAYIQKNYGALYNARLARAKA